MSVDTRPSAATSTGLAEEGALLARYLLRGREVAPLSIERYVAACGKLFGDPASAEDLAVLELARRRPWTLPLLDAASGLAHPHALLRKKLFLMLAILETMPAHAETFIPRPRPRWRVILRLAAWGALGGLKATAGLGLYSLARRAR